MQRKVRHGGIYERVRLGWNQKRLVTYHQRRNPGRPVAAVRGLAEARLCSGVYGCRPTVDPINHRLSPYGTWIETNKSCIKHVYARLTSAQRKREEALQPLSFPLESLLRTQSSSSSSQSSHSQSGS